MDTFEYVTVLISIIVGIGITHLLMGLGRLLGSTGTRKSYWLHTYWMINVLFYLISFWWFTYKLRDQENWDFAHYLFLIIYASVVCLLSAVLFPVDLPEKFDFKTHYFKSRKSFFPLFSIAGLLDVGDTVMKGTDNLELVGSLYWFIQSIWQVWAWACFLSEKRWVHIGYALFWSGTILFFMYHSQFQITTTSKP